MFLGDLKTHENPGDDFKKDRVICKKKKENLTKAMTGNFMSKTVRIRPQKKRWSDVEGPFKCNVPVCDNFPVAQEYLVDKQGLYSSFSPDRVFTEHLLKKKVQ